MGPYIDGTKKEIVKFIDTIKENCISDLKNLPEYKEDFVDLQFEVAVIAYRDFCDPVHFDTLDFTTNIKDVENKLKIISADGGGDEPEDVQGAFIHALFGISNISKKLSWESHGEIAGRNIIWMSDAPAHGKDFINGNMELTNFDPNNSYLNEWNIIFDELKRLNITLYSAKLTNSTDESNKMLKKLATDKCKFTEIDISQSVKQQGNLFDHSKGYTNLSRTISRESSSNSSAYYCEKMDLNNIPDKITI
jgi:hypothetical protein